MQVRFAATLPMFAAVATLALGGCGSRTLYHSVQGWQQQECRKINDHAERQRCLASHARSYDEYSREREAARGKS
jgi:hypothetical protein